MEELVKIQLQKLYEQREYVLEAIMEINYSDPNGIIKRNDLNTNILDIDSQISFSLDRLERM